MSAVMREPERSSASTTITAAESAAMIRLRAGNAQRITDAPGGISEMAQPAARIALYRRSLLRGYTRSAPPARTATVGPPTSRAPTCEAESTPSAIPLTTVIPEAARPWPRSFATSSA
jgi:hypothetical protein